MKGRGCGGYHDVEAERGVDRKRCMSGRVLATGTCTYLQLLSALY
jgi:hypothetical protein